MRAGELRSVARVEMRSASKDAAGGQSNAWTLVDTCPCKIEPISIGARFAAAAVQSDVTNRITVRYVSSVWVDSKSAAKLRLRVGTRKFDIRGMENVDERNREVVLNASEGMSEG